MVVEVGKIVGMVAEKEGQRTIDMLQQLLQEEISKTAQGTLKARFLVDGGFEGEVKIEVSRIRVRADEQKLIVEVDGYNGEIVFELSKS